MEKAPKFRIVGSASEDAKKQTRQEIENALFNHYETLTTEQIDKLEKLEYPKTKVEKSLIDFANMRTNRLMEECGLDFYNIPEENYHLVPPDLYNKIAGKDCESSAIVFYTKQGIFFNAGLFRANPLYFASSAFHETLHLKGHFSVEAEEKDGEKIVTPYREGVSVTSSQKLGNSGRYHEHFRGLHEAIVSAQQKKELPKILELPVFADEKERLNSDESKSIRKKARKRKTFQKTILYGLVKQRTNGNRFRILFREKFSIISALKFKKNFLIDTKIRKRFLTNFLRHILPAVGFATHAIQVSLRPV